MQGWRRFLLKSCVSKNLFLQRETACQGRTTEDGWWWHDSAI